MPRLAPNAEVYASTRIGLMFPAHNQTPADGNLTGQCVTLNKWFLAEMTSVPSPFAARGDARYVGANLVAQGHATKVPYDQRRRGDFAVFEYGQYGHIGVLLDADRIFEQNVNVGGVARKLIKEGSESWYVYASRVGRLSETWRPVQATIYRINSYSEEGSGMVNITEAVYNDLTKWKANGLELVRDRDQNLYPMIERQKATIAELVKERDTVNYPKINAITTALALPSDASAQWITEAVQALKDASNSDNEHALQLIIKDKDEQIAEITGNFTKLAAENDELKKQVAAGGSDTELLNGFGKFLRAMIERLGLK